MAENDLLIDGCMDFLGGQDASKIPDRIAENCYYAGVNVSTYKGSLRPRWGFDKKKLTFDGSVKTLSNKFTRSYEDIFRAGKYQGSVRYTVGEENYIVIVISGVIYLVNLETFEVSVAHIDDTSLLDETIARVNYVSAGRYLVFFDFPAYPVVLDNGVARRANPDNYEIPVSVLGAYNQNRLFIANDGNEFTAGDPAGYGSPSGAPITFEEIMLPGASYYGQVFQLPTDYSNSSITAMGFLQMVDTSTGIGPLLVSTDKAVYAYNSHNPRSSWEAGVFGQNILFNTGIAGQQAMCNVGSDMFFVSSDGQLRTLSMSRAEQGKWTKEPISREVENWLKYWDKSLVNYCTLAYFKNKIFVAANPYRVRAYTTNRLPIADYVFGGMVVLEMDNLATLGTTSNPTWAGLWTGVHPMGMVEYEDRLFVVSKDDASRNEVYEVRPDLTYDKDGANIRYINSKVYTREHSFRDPFVNKQLTGLMFNFDNIQGDFELNVKYKPSHDSRFFDWNSIKYTSPWRICSSPCGKELFGFEGQVIRDVNFGTPREVDYQPVTSETSDYLRKVQLKLSITGKYWEIHEYKIFAREKKFDPEVAECTVYDSKAVLGSCNDDWSVGAFETCHKTVT